MVGEVIYRYYQYPIITGMNIDLKKGFETSGDAINLQDKIQTNIVTKWKTKTIIKEIKNKKRTIIISSVLTGIGLFLGGWGGWELGKKFN